MLRCDVVVVGGRVAGALTAVLFAQRGLQVTLLDRARFPSPTLSTHFFRGAGLLGVIERAGLLARVEELGAPRLTREYNYVNGGVAAVTGPPQDPGTVGYCLSVRREPLDATLLDGARRAGTHVLTSTCVVGVTQDSGRVTGVTLADGSRVTAALVVGADGLHSPVAAQVGAPSVERHNGRRALYYRYVRAMPGPNATAPDGPEFSLMGDELAYVFPSDGGLSCVAISVNLAEYDRMRHEVAARFDALLRRHRGVWERYAACPREGRVLGRGPQPDFVRHPAGPGWALVGDSGMHQDPWTGLGMDNAAVSAELLVDAYVAAGGGEDWRDAYVRRRDDALLDSFHDTVTGAADLSAMSD